MSLKTKIIDTTLRDGEQSAGIAFGRQDKINLFKMMDEIGVYQVEVGNPSLSKYEEETIKEIVSLNRNTRVAAWTPFDKNALDAAIRCKADVVHMSIPASYVYIYSILKKNKQWLKSTLTEYINYANSKDVELSIGFEDASRADISFIISLAIKLQELGIKRVRYADTVGILIPEKVNSIVNNLRYYTDLEVEMHAHNDFGLAIPNSIEAVKAGASIIDCTLLGIGERAGNCDFLKFIKATEGEFNVGLDKEDVSKLQKEMLSILKKRRANKVLVEEKVYTNAV